MRNGIEELVGKKINRIFMNDEFLRFDTDQGDVSYEVYGDCCSHSYFHDFIGVEKLLKNGPVLSVEAISLDDIEIEDDWDHLQAYGFRIITEDEKFGEVSSVFSFRNRSNGYYGGWMERANYTPADLPEITADVLGD